MAVTSQQPTADALEEVVVEDWRGAGLLKPSVVKPVLTTIDPALILKKLGRLTASDQVHLRQALAQILGQSSRQRGAPYEAGLTALLLVHRPPQ